MTLPPVAAVDLVSVWIAAASLAVAVAALVIASIAWRRSDRNTSAGTLVSLFEAFRHGWDRFLDEPDAKRRDRNFHDLMNMFEVACAIHQDRSVHGASRELLEHYLRDTLSIIAKNDGARALIARMRGDPNVFKFLRRFLKEMRQRGHPHFIEPMVTKPASDVRPADPVDPASPNQTPPTEHELAPANASLQQEPPRT
ncbi:MAG: hypothetical protein K2X25_13535 [Caulobacteraceae bacterium]|nr:hypothetical protein [Caulobacteraceae bacterium]